MLKQKGKKTFLLHHSLQRSVHDIDERAIWLDFRTKKMRAGLLRSLRKVLLQRGFTPPIHV